MTEVAWVAHNRRAVLLRRLQQAGDTTWAVCVINRRHRCFRYDSTTLMAKSSRAACASCHLVRKCLHRCVCVESCSTHTSSLAAPCRSQFFFYSPRFAQQRTGYVCTFSCVIRMPLPLTLASVFCQTWWTRSCDAEHRSHPSAGSASHSCWPGARSWC